MTIRANPKPPYTATEYEVALQRWLGDDIRVVDDPVIAMALRIASRVMAEGVIEAAVTRRLNDESSPTDDDLSAAVRAVLLEDAGTGTAT